MTFDADAVTDLVAEFCRGRNVADGSWFRVVRNLDEAFDTVVLKGPDRRWRTIVSRACPTDVPEASGGGSDGVAERTTFGHAVREYNRCNRSELSHPARAWCLKHIVVSAHHWAKVSQTMRTARELGLGWIVPANKDVLIVPAPAMRCLEDRPGVLHDDSGRRAVEWTDGTGFHFLRGCPIGDRLYARIVGGDLSLGEVAALGNADLRSIALSYMTFKQLVTMSNARIVNVGVKGTALYRLPLPAEIARDRVRGYGNNDYFIYMRDASHPEREFIEWVDPKVAAHEDAELCQAHAFGISLSEWLSIEQEG